jgi:hypothetical protein
MRTYFLLTLLFGLTGCKKESVLPDVNSLEILVASQPTWKTESLNEDYTIQFPAQYEGNGMVGFEGPTYSKNRSDRKVVLSYFFCGPLLCSSYGPAIQTPYPSIPYPTSVTLSNTVLDHSVAIRRGGQLEGVFYFAKVGKGLLYLKSKHSGLLMQSLTVDYEYSLHTEVLGILQTIQPRS